MNLLAGVVVHFGSWCWFEVGNRSSEFHPEVIRRVRCESSYIYELGIDANWRNGCKGCCVCLLHDANVNGDGEGNVDALATTMKKNMKHLYNKTDPILVLADNELDFCNELVKKLDYWSNITAATVGPEPNIGIAKERLQQLQAMKIKVYHNINSLNPIIPIPSIEPEPEGKEKGLDGKKNELDSREKRRVWSRRGKKELHSEGKENVREPKGQEKAPDGEDKRLDPTFSIIVLFEPTFPDATGKWDAPKTIK